MFRPAKIVTFRLTIHQAWVVPCPVCCLKKRRKRKGKEKEEKKKPPREKENSYKIFT